MKIIIVLRNPVDRAYSNYLHAVRLLSEPLSFEQAIVYEPYRKKMNYAWPFLYVEAGMYYQPVKHYVTSFSHVKIFMYEDLAKETFLTELFDFLEVDRVQLDIFCKHNVSTIPKHPWLSKFLLSMSKSKLNRLLLPIKLKQCVGGALEIVNTCKPPQLQKETRLYLQTVFKNDMESLQQLIKRDISAWINGE
ncbi:MAG: sulfotransferase domain-containing protein [Deltaproteobacteria bacterium]|nr:sulfotransferase domain-containing protein [Deltaproteobacteria bacterium]